MNPHLVRIHPEKDEQLVERLFTEVKSLSEWALATRGSFHIVLAGGTTPKTLYSALVNLETDWSRWFVYFGDERCLPAGDAERNDQMACDTWLKLVTIPDTQIFPIPSELGATIGAIHYRQLLVSIVNFDLVLLGIGEDGHTASLFPGHELGRTTDYPDVLAVHDAPKQPSERISMSASRLSRSDNVWVIATGEGKREALEQWLSGAELPVSAIQPENGIDLYTNLVL